jgi:hypothetical protein
MLLHLVLPTKLGEKEFLLVGGRWVLRYSGKYRVQNGKGRFSI